MSSLSQPPPTEEQLEEAYKADLQDKDGNKATFGELVKGKRTCVIFIRHFWCGVCQAYIAQMSDQIPPDGVPEDTQIIYVGCGASSPMQRYIERTNPAYPIWTNPSLSLYKSFEFKSNLGYSQPGQEKDYEKVLGSQTKRVWDSLKAGPMKNISSFSAVGPKTQNGGEMLLEADGSCSFFHRMQHTADHIELEDLAKVIGAKYVPPQQTNGHGAESNGIFHVGNSVACDTGVKV